MVKHAMMEIPRAATAVQACAYSKPPHATREANQVETGEETMEQAADREAVLVEAGEAEAENHPFVEMEYARPAKLIRVQRIAEKVKHANPVLNSATEATMIATTK